MRAAILTTAFVIVALFVWSSSRERERRELAGDAAAPPSPRTALPDVAAGAAAAADTAAPSSDARAPVYEPATAQPAREHVVAAGDSLPGLAARYYGDPARADEIYRANRDRIRDPDRLHPGQTLVIP